MIVGTDKKLTRTMIVDSTGLEKCSRGHGQEEARIHQSPWTERAHAFAVTG